MQRYKEYVLKMIEDNKSAFEDFRELHDKYTLDQDRWQEEFNVEGEKILEIVREYENRLCANQERGMYNKFSVNLAEKFQNEVRKFFPLIDHVGIITTKAPNNFFIKKIELNS